MKKIINFILVSLLLITIVGCGKDNFDEPNVTLTGKVTYNGQPVQLRGTGGAVQLQLYQDGFELFTPIAVYVGQDGAFSAKLFNGQYKLITRDNNGPWVNTRDTSIVNVSGNTSFDIAVTPFFTISNESITLSGNTINATFTINRIVETAEVDIVYLLLSRTQFCDQVNYVYRRDFSDQTYGPVSVSGDFGDIYDATTAPTLFGRVGVKSTQTGEAIFSPVVRLR